MDSTKQRLIKRLSWYAPTELANAWIFTGVALWTLYKVGLVRGLIVLYGLCIMVFILFQGARYWRIKLLALQGTPVDNGRETSHFARCRRINLLLIALIPVVALIQYFMSGANASWGWGP